MRIKVLGLVAALVTGAFAGAVPAHAADKTVNCTAVDSKAAVGHPGTVQVTYTTGNKICKFSVNGAAVDAGGTSAEALFSGANAMELARAAIFSGSFDASSQQDTEALVTFLTGPFLPGGQTEIANAMRDAIASEQGFLSECLQLAGIPGAIPLKSTDRLVCGQLELATEPITLPVADLVSIEGTELGGTNADLDGSVVVIGARVEDEVFVVVVPQLSFHPQPGS